MVRQGILGLAILGLYAALFGQQSALLNFFAHAGSCEMDFDKNGRVDYWYSSYQDGLTPDQLQLSLDNAIRFAGVASQRLRLQRSSGGAGSFTIFCKVHFDLHLRPAVGEPLLVRLALRAEGFQNARYRVYVSTGQRQVDLISETSQDTGGWRQLSAVVPVECDANGAPQFSLRIEIRANEGAASGTLWIDEAQAISARSVMRTNRLPNGLRLALTYLYRNNDPYRYLELPVGVIVGFARAGTTFAHHHPDVIWMPYCTMPGTIVSPDARHNGDLYNYDDVERNHPEWFLLDRNGQRILEHGTFYYLDIGRQDVRERAWQSLRDFLNRCGRPRYIFLDNYNVRVGSQYAPPNYPTNDLWVQAVLGWTEYLGSRLLNEFRFADGSYPRFVTNSAATPGFWLRGIPGVSQDAPGVALLPYIGGFFIEHAFIHARPEQGRTTIQSYGTANDFRDSDHWTRGRLRNTIRLATDYPDKLLILVPTLWINMPDSSQKLRFAIAGCLIIQHENTFIHISPTYEREQEPYRSGYYPPELFVPLGLPRGNFQILNGDIIVGGLFVREYQNGVVVWNPRHDATYTYTVPRDYYDWDRNLVRAGTQVQVPPQTGLVFYAAPEITISLSPAQANVLPGQTVEFTVRYRNTGTAAGTDVRISVPLPDGMTLVSSSPTARLEGRQLVWIVPSVPVNGEGTLRFTVRVE
jgi:uncharacterized repeat protein (TIGR01451 family)